MDTGALSDAMDSGNVVFLSVGEDDVASDVAGDLASDDRTVIFISVSKPAMTRKKELVAQGVSDENVFFIDGSGSDEGAVRQENVAFVNPANLTELSIALNQAVETMSLQGPVVVMLDALESLGMYSDEQIFRRFIHVLCNKMRAYGAAVVLIGTADSIDPGLRSLLNQFADKTVDAEA